MALNDTLLERDGGGRLDIVASQNPEHVQLNLRNRSSFSITTGEDLLVLVATVVHAGTYGGLLRPEEEDTIGRALTAVLRRRGAIISEPDGE